MLIKEQFKSKLTVDRSDELPKHSQIDMSGFFTRKIVGVLT